MALTVASASVTVHGTVVDTLCSPSCTAYACNATFSCLVKLLAYVYMVTGHNGEPIAAKYTRARAASILPINLLPVLSWKIGVINTTWQLLNTVTKYGEVELGDPLVDPRPNKVIPLDQADSMITLLSTVEKEGFNRLNYSFARSISNSANNLSGTDSIRILCAGLDGNLSSAARLDLAGLEEERPRCQPMDADVRKKLHIPANLIHPASMAQGCVMLKSSLPTNSPVIVYFLMLAELSQQRYYDFFFENPRSLRVSTRNSVLYYVQLLIAAHVLKSN
ncbi:hypothetical protein M422DRAFT_275840 [Sphaerobolus stellatus SS14]|uniref:Uncharacterized protein n=1 Tax=Sphaerobolus stellatus (strain SS14) TaxID=990650 RepID=A0A0C9T3W4_SPHS4|nr:hypothetical protein M422DRAFT_275840 [Sphaerobolus stellatus SS14]